MLKDDAFVTKGSIDRTLVNKQDKSTLEEDVSSKGFTKNQGTITEVKMNGSSKGTSGVIDLGTVLTAHQDISGKADTSYVDSQVATKQDTLVSGTNIKTINSQSLLGSGDIAIGGAGIEVVTITETHTWAGFSVPKMTVELFKTIENHLLANKLVYIQWQSNKYLYLVVGYEASSTTMKRILIGVNRSIITYTYSKVMTMESVSMGIQPLVVMRDYISVKFDPATVTTEGIKQLLDNYCAYLKVKCFDQTNYNFGMCAFSGKIHRTDLTPQAWHFCYHGEYIQLTTRKVGSYRCWFSLTDDDTVTSWIELDPSND